MVLGALISFVVALLVGGLGIYVGARFVTGEDDYGYAVYTALIGAVAWVLTSWVPIVGSLLALVVWVAVINWRYKGGWIDAAIIGVIAWLAAAVVLFVLDPFIPVGAVGIPGV